ncbi:MAG: hypothetical protein KJI71_05765 [Patescibacteria group bacterium]|nr:hypothetical protein [Patescibacteria group bacterium]
MKNRTKKIRETYKNPFAWKIISSLFIDLYFYVQNDQFQLIFVKKGKSKAKNRIKLLGLQGFSSYIFVKSLK